MTAATLDRNDAAVRLMATAANATGATVGGFGAECVLPHATRRLVMSVDGVGSKTSLAFRFGGAAHTSIAADLVNHCANDVLAGWGRPLFFLDYLAVHRIDAETVRLIGDGLSAACVEHGVELVGGETAELPDVYAPGEYDLAGFMVGASTLFGNDVRAGDVLIGLPSDGLHTNGYAAALRILGHRGVFEERRDLMRPHRSYVRDVLPLIERDLVSGMAHVTGGGLIGNVPRMMPADLAPSFDFGAWTPPPFFRLLVEQGRMPVEEQYRTFNMGIGFVLAARDYRASHVLAAYPDAVVIGSVIER